MPFPITSALLSNYHLRKPVPTLVLPSRVLLQAPVTLRMSGFRPFCQCYIQCISLTRLGYLQGRDPVWINLVPLGHITAPGPEYLVTNKDAEWS